MFVWTSMPLYCGLLLISAMNQAVRKASWFPYSKQIASEEERAANRAAKTPVLRKPITSELGCVTPYIVAPAQYLSLIHI